MLMMWFKENIVKIFDEGGFKLHKWYSSYAELQVEENHSQVETENTCMKQQLIKEKMKTTILETGTSKMINKKWRFDIARKK